MNDDGPQPVGDPSSAPLDEASSTAPAGGSSSVAPSSPEGRRSKGLLVVVVAVLVVLVVGLTVWLVRRDESSTTTGAEAAERFVAAYTRQLDGTYLVDGEFTRTTADGRTLRSAYLSVQSPPNRIQRSLGSTSGVVNGRTVNCSTPAGGTYSCAAAGEARPWDEERASILAALDQYVRGDDPLYSVTQDSSGCFDLVRRRSEPGASFGRRARVCFDETYGAQRRLEVEHDGGVVDVVLATLVTDRVTAADFDLEADATYDPVVPDDPGAVTPTTSQEPPS